MDFKVIKLGGKVIDQPELLQSFLEAFATLTRSCPSCKFVLVHGGGAVASKVSERLGLAVKMIDGRRVTDLDTMRVVQGVYAGLINKSMVAQLVAKGCQAVGLTGADADLIRAHRRPPVNGIDYGYVGDVDRVNAKVFMTFFEQGFLPVLAPLSHDGLGQLLNTNADTIASEVAKALTIYGDVELIFAFENPGVLIDLADPSQVYQQLDDQTYALGKKEHRFTGGILPKLENAFAALRGGVKQVRICHWQNLAQLKDISADIGTRIVLE